MIGRPLIRLDAVSSTQDVAFRLAERGATDGTTVRASYQSGGRGRAGRAWKAAPGEALLFSIVLRPVLSPAELAPLSILIGDAVAATLAGMFTLQPAIKWPNDVMLNGRKVSGILIQTRRLAGQDLPVAVIGTGINVNSARDDLPAGATSVRAEVGENVDTERVFRDVLDQIELRFRALETRSIEPHIDSVNDRLWLRGEQVSLDDADRVISGRLDRVDVDGALLLHTSDGTRRIVSGELTRGPRILRP